MSGSPTSKFDNLPITRKLSRGQGALVGLFALLLIVIWAQILYVQNTANEATNRLKSTAMLRQVQYDVTDMLALTRGVMLTKNEFLSGLYKEREQTFNQDLAELKKLFAENPEGLKLAGELGRNVTAMSKVFAEQMELALSDAADGQQQAIQMEIDGVSWPPLEKVLFSINDLVELQTKEQALTDSNMSNAFLVQNISLAVAFIAGVFLAIYIARFIGRSIAPPLQEITGTMRSLAAGKLDTDIPYADRDDEIGDMSKALSFFRDELSKTEKLTEEREAAQQAQIRESELRQQEEREKMERERLASESRQRQAERVEQLIAQFDETISNAIGRLDGNAGQMRNTAGNMVSIADMTRDQAGTVTAASNEMQGNISTMASAIEEFAASIAEVSNQIQNAGRMSSEAVNVANSGSDAISTLSAASSKIEDVVKLINDIAEQTNLLALNATIEAARAGDAGKGFAVVASEVKSLANQTAGATEEITNQIAEMQGLTGKAVEAMSAIDETIGSLNELTLAVSASIEEQEATTQEISRSVQFAAEKTNEVTEQIAMVSDGANQTGEASGNVQQASEELEALSTDISKNVHDFLAQVRAQ
ncbi:HAMP domain-containing protein [Kordiimonas sp. SCSIO 12603]|uniref:methyl-accepting chemotaxis protein n=1 Tax=Kordiimonas sp. SCSIO 12603 TaxID=2829596 RepID=UPI002102EBE5|nr:methyl-accepting chemotaxis protein [Kordiimonas sp. SCSIO 12603]UTW59777.1 HAMP domain-containing protein [Kordiimonas sp. SCSIO 12603]